MPDAVQVPDANTCPWAACRVSECLKGNVGLFLTSKSREEVERVFAEYRFEDFARAGGRALEAFELQEGPLEGPTGPLAHTLEPMLRQVCLPLFC